tara:strand:- start:667 stop:837 length:171 start_codon:yes stop_codon:yes gene_type:complete
MIAILATAEIARTKAPEVEDKVYCRNTGPETELPLKAPLKVKGGAPFHSQKDFELP